MPKPQRHHLDRRVAQVLAAAPASLPTTLTDDTLLSTKQTAAWLGVSEQWLELGRKQNYGPEWVRLGPRTTRYRYGGVVRWLKQRVRA
jgi:hypothetical protein